MSLDNIKLPAFLVEELYRDSLVKLTPEHLTTTVLQEEELSFLGNNKHNILLIVNEPGYAFLKDEDLRFLLDILGACKLSMEDIALINFDKNPGIRYPDLLSRFAAGKLLFFGIEPTVLGVPLQFPYYQLQQYDNKTFLNAPSLRQLAANKKEKLLLWTNLRKLFQV